MFDGPYTLETLQALAAIVDAEEKTVVSIRAWEGKLEVQTSHTETYEDGGIKDYSVTKRTYYLHDYKNQPMWEETITHQIIDGLLVESDHTKSWDGSLMPVSFKHHQPKPCGCRD